MDVLTHVALYVAGSDASAQQLRSNIKVSAVQVRARLPFVGRASIIDTCAKQVSSCIFHLILAAGAPLHAAEVCACESIDDI